MSAPISIVSRKLLVLLLILCGFVGCTYHVTVKQYPMKEGMVPDFVGQQPVNVINAQSSAGEILVGQAAGYRYYTDLQKCTDTAIKVLENELDERNIVTTSEAEKKIILAITEVNVHAGFSHFRCTLNLKVETGDGYTRVFIGDDKTYMFPERACGAAILRAVAAMLNDDTILAYLKL